MSVACAESGQRAAAGVSGVERLSDGELLSILFRRGSRQLGGAALAGRLLAHFGGFRRLLNADPEELGNVRGIGAARLATLAAVREIARRYFEETLPVGEAIRSPADTETFLLARLRDRPHEIFCCLFLDNRHRVLGFDELFRGTIDGTSVYPRESRQAGAADQCRGRDPRPQSPVGRRRAEPGRRAHHPPRPRGARTRRYPSPRPPDHRRRNEHFAGR